MTEEQINQKNCLAGQEFEEEVKILSCGRRNVVEMALESQWVT